MPRIQGQHTTGIADFKKKEKMYEKKFYPHTPVKEPYQCSKADAYYDSR